MARSIGGGVVFELGELSGPDLDAFSTAVTSATSFAKSAPAFASRMVAALATSAAEVQACRHGWRAPPSTGASAPPEARIAARSASGRPVGSDDPGGSLPLRLSVLETRVASLPLPFGSVIALVDGQAWLQSPSRRPATSEPPSPFRHLPPSDLTFSTGCDGNIVFPGRIERARCNKLNKRRTNDGQELDLELGWSRENEGWSFAGVRARRGH